MERMAGGGVSIFSGVWMEVGVVISWNGLELQWFYWRFLEE